MISADLFTRAAAERGFRLYAGVPCSYLKPFINYVIDAEDLHYVAAANEGEAVAIAAGASLAGTRAIAMFQNSGLGNAVNPLTSLTATFKIPILLIVTLRGEPGGPADEPQHQLMGEITTSLLELMGIAWDYFPTTNAAVAPALERACASMQNEQRPYALVMRKDTVAAWPLHSQAVSRPLLPPPTLAPHAPAAATRSELLHAIQAAARPTDVLLATTGYTGRELYASGDCDNQFYMVGSMGCNSSFGLGIALCQPQRRIIVIDGDGAMLMRLGALTTLGYQRPGNLLHILLDNELHESTGSQATVSHSIDFCAIAAACGYAEVHRATTPEDMQAYLQSPRQALSFMHFKIKPGVRKDLPRPQITPPEVAARLATFLAST